MFGRMWVESKINGGCYMENFQLGKINILSGARWQDLAQKVGRIIVSRSEKSYVRHSIHTNQIQN